MAEYNLSRDFDVGAHLPKNYEFALHATQGEPSHKGYFLPAEKGDGCQDVDRVFPGPRLEPEQVTEYKLYPFDTDERRLHGGREFVNVPSIENGRYEVAGDSEFGPVLTDRETGENYAVVLARGDTNIGQPSYLKVDPEFSFRNEQPYLLTTTKCGF